LKGDQENVRPGTEALPFIKLKDNLYLGTHPIDTKWRKREDVGLIALSLSYSEYYSIAT
jgi:hypothetical protein